LPSTVRKAIGQPPLSDLIKVAGKGPVVLYVQFELVKMASRVSVGGNLNDGQVQFIATQLVEFFPAESLADFKICFERGCMGQYGEIFRMDGIVLRKWMEQYLEEKYALIDQEWEKEKGEHKKQIDSENPQQDWYKIWLDSVADKDHKPRLGISDKEIQEEGQVKPKKISYPSTSEREIEKRELHLQWIRENFDARTGEKLDSFMDEIEWLKTKSL